MKKMQRNQQRFMIIILINEKKIKRNTSFKVENVSGDVISKDNFGQEQITKPKNFLAKRM